MSTVRISSNSNGKWFALLGLATAVAAALIWRSDGGGATRLQAQEVSKAIVPAQLAQAIPQTMQASEQDMQFKQAEAARELDRQPGLPPMKGPITSRPSFVSELEWSMLTSLAQQHATPDKELTRLVNFLRFNKQLESWEALPKTADVAKRQALAAPLLDDLPQRVANEEIDLKTAQKTQLALLADAEPDVQARAKRAALEAKRLTDAASPKS